MKYQQLIAARQSQFVCNDIIIHCIHHYILSTGCVISVLYPTSITVVKDRKGPQRKEQIGTVTWDPILITPTLCSPFKVMLSVGL